MPNLKAKRKKTPIFYEMMLQILLLQLSSSLLSGRNIALISNCKVQNTMFLIEAYEGENLFPEGHFISADGADYGAQHLEYFRLTI